MKKIIGIQELKGDFEGKSYHVYRFYVQVENKENDKGIITEIIKVRLPIIEKVLADRNLNDVNDLLNTEIKDIYYDSYKNVVDIVG